MKRKDISNIQADETSPEVKRYTKLDRTQKYGTWNKKWSRHLQGKDYNRILEVHPKRNWLIGEAGTGNTTYCVKCRTGSVFNSVNSASWFRRIMCDTLASIAWNV